MKVIDYLKENGIKALEQEYSILVKEYDELYVLNYNQIESPKTSDIVKECRGLILDKEFNVVSRSFDRFLNYGEAGCGEDLDITKCSIHEKVDGSLIKIYCYKGVWYVSTRGTAYAESGVSDFGITFKELVYKALQVDNEEDFQFECSNCLFEENTYIFEVTSRENRVVTRYDGYDLWFLACRSNSCGTYIEASAINHKRFRAKLPKVYTFNTVDEMIEASKSLPNLEEGYVVYSEGVPMCKVKSPLYLTVHRIRGEGSLSNKRIMQLLLMNEQDEYLTYYPEDQQFFDPVQQAYESLLCRITVVWEESKHLEDKKEFALAVKDNLFSAVLFTAKMKNEHPIHVWHSQADSYKLKVLGTWVEEYEHE